jgi:hypothetical protein
MIITATTASRNPIRVFGGKGRPPRRTPIEFFEGVLGSMASRLAVLEILREKLKAACRKRPTFDV